MCIMASNHGLDLFESHVHVGALLDPSLLGLGEGLRIQGCRVVRLQLQAVPWEPEECWAMWHLLQGAPLFPSWTLQPLCWLPLSDISVVSLCFGVPQNWASVVCQRPTYDLYRVCRSVLMSGNLERQ